MDALFVKAAKNKVRFDTTRGQVTVEDLFDMPLEGSKGFNLDEVAKGLAAKLKESEVTSFVKKEVKGDSLLQLQFDIVKFVIDYRLAARDRVEKAAATRSRNDKIRNLIQQKKDQALLDASIEDLEGMLAAEENGTSDEGVIE